VLIAPVTTMYYDSGFIIGLKAFVARSSAARQLSADRARRAGGRRGREFRVVLERALKDVIVFSLLIPVLKLRSFYSAHS
jgi:branched-chain amino acid transport system permease protein